MNKTGRLFISVIVLAGTGLAAWPAAADRDRDERRHRHDRYDRHDDRRGHGRKDDRPIIVYQNRPTYVVQGPPDWAPAHGFRRKQAQYVPYGLAQGRCDRNELGEIVGAVAGGVAGGLAGSRIGQGSGNTVAIIGGAIAGTLVGGSIGRGMDRIDQSCVGHSLEYAPTGRPVVWRNPARGMEYQVVPIDTFQDRSGRYCREYTTQVLVGGRRQEAYGTACRQPDGAWEVVS